MLRIIAIPIALVLALAEPALAQVTRSDDTLQDQLLPESLKFEASAVATKINLF
jgi:hypothetical protein